MAAKYHNILIVGGVTLPDPSEMVISDYDISESERNANGKMVSRIRMPEEVWKCMPVIEKHPFTPMRRGGRYIKILQ